MAMNRGRDINELRRLLALGQITEDDLTGMTLGGSAGTANALAELIEPDLYQAPQGRALSEQESYDPRQFNPDAPAEDRPAMPMNSMRNEQTGQMTYFGPQGPRDKPYTSLEEMFTAQKSRQPMRVAGFGNGTMTDLGAVDEEQPALDYAQPIDVAGKKGYRSKDGKAAYVQGAQGTEKVILGYDREGSARMADRAFKQRKGEAELEHLQEQTRALRMNNPDFNLASGPQAAQGPTGEDVLAGVPKPIADQVKALAEGRMQFPGGFALRSPYWQNMISLVSKYDPNFDAINYNSRAITRKDFTSGRSAQSLNALNTVMGHLDDLEKTGLSLGNTAFPLYNKAANYLGSAVDPELKGKLNSFQVARQAVASELERAYRGTGGSMQEIEAWKKTLDDADSPEAIQAAVKQAVTLLGSKIAALGDTYNKGMGTTKQPFDLLSPKARTTYARITGEGDEGMPAMTVPGMGQAQEQFRQPGARDLKQLDLSRQQPAQSRPQRLEMDEPPDPRQFKGKRMTAPDGSRYVSDGARWVRQ